MNIKNARCLHALDLRFQPGKFRSAVTLAPLTFQWEDKFATHELVVPSGTRYNGVGPGTSSFGWILEVFVPRWGRGMIASLPHDVAFESRFTAYPSVKAARKYADELFLALLISTGPTWERDRGWLRSLSTGLETASWRLSAWMMYYAVRWLGAGTWNEHDRDFRQRDSRADPAAG